MSLKALFLFLAASAVAFAVQTRDGETQTTTLGDSVGETITVSRL